mmetsp:Transcript_88963/g.160439  ORF Transcript_88963/g.160439 Transcript_88963/m.160439 type:complete len:296 (-) Transcript_88963:771-1658(-)
MPSSAVILGGGTESRRIPKSICAKGAILRFVFHCSNNSTSLSSCAVLSDNTQRRRSMSLRSEASGEVSLSASASPATGAACLFFLNFFPPRLLSPPLVGATDSPAASLVAAVSGAEVFLYMLRPTTSIVWSHRICFIWPGLFRSRASVRAASIFPSRTSKPILESFMATSAVASWRSFASSTVESRQTQSLESEPPETIRFPTTSMHQTFPSCSSNVAAHSAVRICHSFKSPSTLLLISCMPLARKATRSTAELCPWNARMGMKSLRFQSRTVASPAAEAITWSIGEKATDQTPR